MIEASKKPLLLSGGVRYSEAGETVMKFSKAVRKRRRAKVCPPPFPVRMKVCRIMDQELLGSSDRTAWKMSARNSEGHRCLSRCLFARNSNRGRFRFQAIADTVRIFRSTALQFVPYFLATSRYSHFVTSRSLSGCSMHNDTA